MSIEVRRLTPELAGDFFQLHSRPPFAWCYCAAWAVPTWDGWGERSAAENRAVRERLFADGRHDGYLLYADGTPVGWCQCAPLAWFPKLIAQQERRVDANVFAVGCLCILPEYRKRGLAHDLLAGVLEDLTVRGVTRVEAYPRCGRHADREVWTGPEAVFERAAFRVVRRDERSSVMEKILE